VTAGRLDIVGLGPGPADWATPEVLAIVEQASDLVGYGPYLQRLPVQPMQRQHASGNRVELERAREALDLALEGRRVALVSSGDPGIFAMAATVFEVIEADAARWRAVEIAVHPGVSAMLAAAARLGAPLGHDFAVMSLSDNLKPWPIVERRLTAAAEADFVMVFYNPASKARPQQIQAALALLRKLRPAGTVVALARAVGHPGEHITLTTLGAADASAVDMNTLVLVGSSATRSIPRGDGRQWIYTPRRYGAST